MMSLFRYENGKVEDKAKSKEMGRPYYKSAIMCRFVKQGGDIVLNAESKAFEETYLTVRNPGDREHVEQVSALREALSRFKAMGEEKIDGLHITEWPMINAAEAENLRVSGVTTVEKLASLDDKELKLQMISRELRDQAAQWLEFAAERGAAAGKAAQLKDDNKALKEENKQLKEEIKSLRTTVEELKKAPPAAPATSQTAGK